MTSTPETVYTGLSPLQADGLACVRCARNYLHSGALHVPVGLSETGSQVFACLGGCDFWRAFFGEGTTDEGRTAR